MKLSTKGRYGLRAMIDLAMHCQGDKVSVKSISERQGISENYLERLFALLKKAGYITSTRGAQGGYVLSRAADAISVGDILRALEGDLTPVECTLTVEGKECSNSDHCCTKTVWKKLTDSINDAVDGISLQNMVDEQQEIDRELCTMEESVNG